MMLLALALLMQQPQAQNFPAIDRPGADPMIAANLQALCPAVDPGDRAALLSTEARQASAAVTANNAEAWLALGCTRALLSTLKGTSHAGPLMLSGDSWAQGAITTVLKVLEMHPGDRRAADVLAVFAMDESDMKSLAKVVARLADAVQAGANGGPTLRACAELSLRVGRADLARQCATAALASGRDSTEHLLLLARLSAREHDTAGASDAFIRAVGAAHDTLAKLAITWHLQWFLTPDERDVWTSLRDSGRDSWVRDRLASRDVRDGQPPGARLVEHFKRLEYADSAFRLKVARVMRNTLMHGASRESTGVDPDFPDTWRDYSRWQTDLDDRGVTWLRFGPPLKRVYREYNKVSYEAWSYELDGKPLLITFAYEPFSGQVGPSRMVSGMIGDMYCGLDAWRCTLGMRRTITADLRQRVRVQDREFIREATTKDDNSPRGDKPIELVARLHRLWDANSGAPLALVTYAVKASDLMIQKNSGGPKTTLIDFDLRRWDAISNAWQDTAFSKHLTVPDSDARKQHLTGFVVTPSSASVTSWSLVASQPDKRRGRMWDDATPPLDRGAVALSDLVLGQEGQGLVWNNHNVAIALAPLNAVNRAHPVSLYYQIRSDRERAGVRTTVAIYHVDNGVARGTAALEVSSSQALRAGINEVAPVIDVSRLDHGSYVLEVQVTDESGAVVSRRSVALNLD